jgi:endonuclease YncB( thermonuclease family)
VDGRDLSRVVLFNGGGRAAAGAPPELRALEQQARAARVGIWGGREDDDD